MLNKILENINIIRVSKYSIDAMKEVYSYRNILANYKSILEIMDIKELFENFESFEDSKENLKLHKDLLRVENKFFKHETCLKNNATKKDYIDMIKSYFDYSFNEELMYKYIGILGTLGTLYKICENEEEVEKIEKTIEVLEEEKDKIHSQLYRDLVKRNNIKLFDKKV